MWHPQMELNHLAHRPRRLRRKECYVAPRFLQIAGAEQSARNHAERPPAGVGTGLGDTAKSMIAFY